MILDFDNFGKLHEAKLVLRGSVLNEGEFDKFAQDLAKENKEDIVSLNPLLNDYMKIKKDASGKRVKINLDVIKETDAKKKEKLNNDLVTVNQDEAKKIEENEKKLANWVEGKQATLNFLMRSKLKEIDFEMLEEEFKKQESVLSDTAKQRMKDIIAADEKALDARVEKMEKMIEDEAADTKGEDDKIVKSEEEAGDAEQDYDADGDVTSDEKKARKQKEKDAENSPLNQI
jgi:hypothetical protein